MALYDSFAYTNFHELNLRWVLKQLKHTQEYIDSVRPRYFDNVNQLIAADLKDGDYAVTKGYYTKDDGGQGCYEIVDDNSLTADGGLIHKLANGLFAKLLVENSTINIKQFGVKDNDPSYDNALILTKLFNGSEYTDYSFYAPSGVYYLLSSVVVTRKCDGFVFKGNGHRSDQSQETGTQFIYTGTDYAFIFDLRLWHSNIENFDILAANGSGLHFIGNISGTTINDIQMMIKDTGIKCEKSGYSYWNNINIVDHTNSSDFIAYDFTSDDSYVVEYVYLNECTAGVYNGTYSGTYSYGVKSNHLNHFYMENCDFVNLSYGLYLDAMGNSKYINLTTSNFACMVNDLYIKSNGVSVSGLYITECSFSIRETNGHILVTDRASGHQLRGFIFENNHIGDLISPITTDYLIVVNSGSLEYASCIIDDNGYNSNSAVPFINLPTLYNAVSPLAHTYYRPIVIGLQGDGSTTTYTETITTDSPFDYRPGVLVTDTKHLISEYSINNTLHGTLSVTLTFSAGYTGRDYISIHVLPDCKISMKNI